MVENKVEVLDKEVEGFELEFCKILTLDLVNPVSIEGESDFYATYFDIKMSNGDKIEYHYNEGKPYSAGEYHYYCTINGEKFNMALWDDHPAIFIREQYMKILKDRIKKER